MNPYSVISRSAPTVEELCCRNCGASLVIVDRNLVECEYCGSHYLMRNMDEVVMEESGPWPDPDYFFRGGCGYA